jgi:error-prone DNA polymerase
MPMGFYQPAQIIIDARKHGVEVRPVDINDSDWDNLLEEKSGKYRVLRLGFRQVKGLREEEMKQFVAARNKRYTTMNELRDSGLTQPILERLADADAFRSIALDRRQALWELSVKDRPIVLFSSQSADDPEKTSLPAMSMSEHVVQDYSSTSLSIKAHPVSFIREKLHQLHILSTSDLTKSKNGDPVKVAGLVLVRQRPGTASGICFMTIEDETGFANAVIFPNLFEKFRREILQSKLILLEGKLQVEGEVIHVIVSNCYNLSALLRNLTASRNEDVPVLTLAFADEKTIPPNQDQLAQQRDRERKRKKIFPEGRNFR